MPNVIRKETLTDIAPDVRLLRVLRNSGFHCNSAMGELLDNSVDAGANEIDVYVYMNNLQKKNIMIVDNGKGMNETTLKYSLTLAKELKVGIDQFGKYGMGMKTAALSFSTQFEIYSKTISGEVIYGEFNINKMEQLGEYKTDIRRATSEEVTFFRSKVGKRKRSGTVIIVKNCDRFDVNFTTFVKQMKSFIGLTYKNHINKGICFTVNDLPVKGDKVVSLDPLMRDFEKTYVITDREGSPVEYQLATGQRKTAFIEVSASVLPRPDANGKGKIIDGKEILIPLNQTNQGIYFYREGRMVGQALNWNNVFGERHNSKNRFRIEINCKSDLDDEIRMNFQKGNVSPTTNLKNQLEQIIEPIMVEMRERLKLEEGETILGQENKSTSVKGKTIEMVISNPKRNNQNGTTPFKVSFKNKEIKNANSVEDLLVAAQKIANILEDENVPDEIKNKFRETLGFVMTTV